LLFADKKPLLSKKYRQTIRMPKKWLIIDEKCKSIIFNNENKFNLFYSDRKVWYVENQKLVLKLKIFCRNLNVVVKM
jgi:hypothetical protein